VKLEQGSEDNDVDFDFFIQYGRADLPDTIGITDQRGWVMHLSEQEAESLREILEQALVQFNKGVKDWCEDD
jgi:hypothetical protein